MINEQPIIERTKGRRLVLHNDKDIMILNLAFGPGFYTSLRAQILNRGYDVPAGDEMASLLYSAYCPGLTSQPEFIEVRKRIHENFLWVYNKNLWTDKGVFVVKYLKSLGRNQFVLYEPFNIDYEKKVTELEKKILKENNAKEIKGIKFSEDGLVRFAPKGSYKLGEMSSQEFAKDGFIIASCGEQGAEKLGIVSSRFSNNPCIDGLDIKYGKSPESGISSVEDVCRLEFVGCSYNSRSFGYAFGIKL